MIPGLKNKNIWGFAATLILLLAGCGAEETAVAESTAAESASFESAAESAGAVQELAPETESALPEAVTEPEMTVEDEIKMKLESMTIEEKIAQIFFIIPDQLAGASGTRAVGDALAERYRQYPVGGLVFFEENIADPEQVVSFTAGLKRLGQERIGLDPFLAVDEEGGAVLRLGDIPAFGLPRIPAMAEVGASGEPEKAAEVGTAIGSYLKKFGFDVDFAPVADVNITGGGLDASRFFSKDPAIVSRMVAAEVTALEAEGISAALKHFPGHGAASGDTHKGAAVVSRSLEELRASEFLPFKAGIESGADFVMVGHIAVPEVTGNDLPSTLSPAVIGLLREELGFDGIVITDAMRMQAITDRCDSGEAAVISFLAGSDMILMPADFDAAYEGVYSAVEDGRISEERLDESVGRILAVKMR